MKKKILVGIGWLLSLLIVAELSASSALKNQLYEFGLEFRRVQAIISINHMERYQELQEYLSRGCDKESLKKAEIAVNTEMYVIASLIERDTDGSINEYIEERDPELLSRIKEGMGELGESWEEPKCINL